MLHKNLAEKFKQKYQHIFVVVLFVLLLFIVLPYKPSMYWSIGVKSGVAFSKEIAVFLKHNFEEAHGGQLQQKLNADLIDYKISQYKARLVLKNTQLNKTRGFTLLIDEPEENFVNLGYAYIVFDKAFTNQEKKLIIASLKETSKNTGKLLQENKTETLNHWDHFADLYSHLVMILLALSIFLLFIRKWNKIFKPEDYYLFPVLLIGFINIFIFTNYAIGDIKLHFFNEQFNVYRWNLYGPGNVALQKFIYRLFFTSDVVLFNVNRVFAVLSAVPLYSIILNRFGGRTNALMAAILLVCHPTWLRYGASDITHPWAIFLFLSAVALIVYRRTPDIKDIILAFVLLAISMLGRGEFMMFAPAALLIVGSDKIIHLFRRRPYSVICGGIILAVIVLPQVITLTELMSEDSDLVIIYRWLAAFSTWFMLGDFAGGYNTFADLQYSPWPIILMTIFGFFVLMVKKPYTAVSLFVCTTLFLWNPYFFIRVFSSTHYQLPALPFYIIFAGIGTGFLVKHLLKKADRISVFIIAVLATLILWYISVFNYSEFLEGDYTYMNQYREIVEHIEDVDPYCILLYTRPYEDYDLHNPHKAWFASQKRFKRYIDLPFSNIPDINNNCLYYLKTPSCSVVNIGNEDELTLFSDQCEDIGNIYTLKPVWESTIKAKDAVGEKYFVEDIPVGLYKLEKK